MQHYSRDVLVTMQPKLHQSCVHLVPEKSHGKCLECSKNLLISVSYLLEVDCFDGERVSNGADRNQNHLCMRFKSLKGHCWFPETPSVPGSNLCNPPVLPVPREGQTGRRPSGYFGEPQQFGGAPPSPGAAGRGRASLPRGSREEPGSLDAEISKGTLGSGSGVTPYWTFVG